MTLLDANVIVFGFNPDSRQYRACRPLMEAVVARVIPGVLVPQVMLEAYAVMTDRRKTERPVPPISAWNEIATLARAVPVVYPQRHALHGLAGIVPSRRPAGQDIFDAFLVAQMRAAGIGTICTYNISDFAGYEGIIPEAPDALLARFGLTP